MNNKDILDNAPEGATHVGIVIYNTAHYYKCESNNWQIMCGNGWTKLDSSELTFLYSPRSIADIEREVGQQAKYKAVCAELEEAQNEINALKIREHRLITDSCHIKDRMEQAEAEIIRINSKAAQPKWTLCSDELAPVGEEVWVVNKYGFIQNDTWQLDDSEGYLMWVFDEDELTEPLDEFIKWAPCKPPESE